MPTIKEIYEGQSSWIFGTNYTSLKPDTETLVEQEISGIRIKSAVEINNPLIYGNEATRITLRSTPTLDKMKDSTGGEGGDGGLIGKGISALTGGSLNSISDVRDKFNSKLGIPTSAIPTFVDNHGDLQKGAEPDTMITLGKIRKDAAGTELGKFLKNSGGGNFQTIGKNLLGQGISLVKDKARDVLLGKSQSIGQNILGGGSSEDSAFPYSSQQSYSTSIRNAKNNEADSDKIQSQGTEKVSELTSKTKEGLFKKKTIGESISNSNSSLDSDREYRSDAPYTKYVETYLTQDSEETDLEIPSAETEDDLAKKTATSQEKNKKIGEDTTPNIEYSKENKYSSIVRDEATDDDQSGEFTRIDLTTLPHNSTDRGTSFFRLPQYSKNPYDIDLRYPKQAGSNEPSANMDSLYGITKGSDKLNLNGISGEGNSKEDLENSDLIPFWIRPLGGESVHFRSSLTGISENVTPSWSANKFYGNPYSFYTYQGVERNCTFTLQLFCYNELELAAMWEKISIVTKQCYPTIGGDNQRRYVTPPIIQFRLGSMYNNKKGFVESLTYNIPDNGTWEIAQNGLYLPKLVDVALTIKLIESIGDEEVLYNYGRSDEATKSINQKRKSSFQSDPQTGGGTDNIGGGAQSNTESSPSVNVNNEGIPQTEQEQAKSNDGINKKPKSLSSKGSQETPKESDSGTSTFTSTQSQTRTESEKKQDKLKSKGIDDWAARVIATSNFNENSVQKISDIDGNPCFYFTINGVSGGQKIEKGMVAYRKILAELGREIANKKPYRNWVKQNIDDPIGTEQAVYKKALAEEDAKYEKEETQRKAREEREKKRNETKKANRDENLKKIKERDEKRKADKQTKLKELKAGI
jgi:hypothetical protein